MDSDRRRVVEAQLHVARAQRHAMPKGIFFVEDSTLGLSMHGHGKIKWKGIRELRYRGDTVLLYERLAVPM